MSGLGKKKSLNPKGLKKFIKFLMTFLFHSKETTNVPIKTCHISHTVLNNDIINTIKKI